MSEQQLEQVNLSKICHKSNIHAHNHSPFITFYINNCMKVNRVDNWVEQNGMNCKYFAALPLAVVQAQKTAHNIVTHHLALLTREQALLLNQYLQTMKNGKKRAKITQAQCYKVMNIGKSVNRKLFKAHKALQR
jgi:hypothetical protein